MDRIAMSQDIQYHDLTVVKSNPERQSLDWDRLQDANDDYDEILFDPNREFHPDLDRPI